MAIYRGALLAGTARRGASVALLVAVVPAAALLTAALCSPAKADGSGGAGGGGSLIPQGASGGAGGDTGFGGNGIATTGAGGGGGAPNPTGPGGPGGSISTGGGGGGGGGSGNPGGPGGSGNFGGAGGTGGTHGQVAAGLPGAAITGSLGDNGDTASAGGGGGGGGGYGAVVTGPISGGILGTGVSGGGGGLGGLGNNGGGAAGGGGGGGIGLLFQGNVNGLGINADVAGGAGGAGGAESTSGGGGGGGGGGGHGAVFGAAANGVVVGGAVTGGAGGAGSASTGGRGGGGGGGGAGMIFETGGSLEVTAGNSVGGGAGGLGGLSNNANGAHGAGGTGVVGSNLTIINSGHITGGLWGDGVSLANAVRFTGGANAFQLRAGGTATGSVVGVSGGNDAFQLGGATNATFDTSLIGSQYLNFVTFQKLGAGTWTLTGTTGSTTPWRIDGGVLSVGADGSLGAVSGGGLSFNGGVLQVTGTTFGSTARTIDLGAVGGSFDIVEANHTFTVLQSLSGTGALFKEGAGTLALSGANTYPGATNVNAGTLQAGAANAFSASSAHGIAAGAMLDLNNLNQTVGSLAGGGNVTLGSATLTAGGDNTSTAFSGVMSGTGGFAKEGTGTQIFSGTNSYGGNTNVNAGTLLVNGAIVSDTTVNAGGTLKGTGQLGAVTVNTGGVYAPGNSIGTQFVNGAFALNPGAIFEVEVNAAGQSDRVVVQGTVNLSGAVLRVLAEQGNYKPKTDYQIVDNDGTDAVTGTFSKVTTNFAFLTPQVTYQGGDGNDVVLTLLRTVVPDNGGNGGFVSFGSVAVTPNQCNVAHALDRFPESDPLFLAVLLQTVGGARQAFDALSGEIHATLPGVLADDSRYVREAVLGRLIQASYTNSTGQFASLAAGGPQVASLNSQAMTVGYGEGKSLAMPPASGPDLAFWTRGYGAWGDFDGNRNAASAERDLGGFVSGADAQVSDTWRIGLAAGGAWSNVSVGARQSSAQLESFHLAGYAGGMAGPLALRAGGAYAWQDVETSRAVVFPGFFERQETSYDADTGQLFGEIAYPIASGGIALEPFAGLAYVNVDTERFREHGGALSALNGSSSDQDIGYSTLGLRAGTALHWGGTLVVPKVSAAWQHAFDDVTPDAALAFASTGIGFGVTGVPLAEDSLLIEAGLDFALSPTATLGVSYSGQVASEAQDNAVKGRLTWLF